MANETRVSIIISADGRAAIESVNKVNQALGDTSAAAGKASASAASLAPQIAGLAAKFLSLAAAMATVKATMDYLGKMETAALGIAAAYMTAGKYIDTTTGKALAAEEALAAAQKDSAKTLEDLQYANLETIATLDELVNAYQVTLPVAMARGFDRKQAMDYTVAMVQAAGAIGLAMNQLGEETRSMLTESIDPRTSRIATVLGLRNEDVRQYKGNAEELFNFLMSRLSAYQTAGVAAQKTWAGLMSNTVDIAKKILGEGMTPLFEAIKYELMEVTKNLVTFDKQTKQIKWNPDLEKGIKGFRDAVEAIIAELYRMGMLLDKIGGRIMSFSPEYNKMFQERYEKSSKALQALALGEMGWKEMTPEVEKQIREAAKKGKKIYDQTWAEVDSGTGVDTLVRYYRPRDQKTKWDANKPPPGDDKDKGKLTGAKLQDASIKAILDEYAEIDAINTKYFQDLRERDQSFRELELDLVRSNKQAELDLQKQFEEGKRDLANETTQINQENIERTTRLWEDASQKEIALKRAVMQNAIGFLGQLAGENKAFAIAAIALQTAFNMVIAYQDAVAASNAAFKWGMEYGGPYAPAVAAAAAASAMAWGMANVALIAASGVLQGYQATQSKGGGAGSPVGGFGSSGGLEKVATTPTENAGPKYTIIVYGNVVDHDKFARELVEPLEKAQAARNR